MSLFFILSGDAVAPERMMTIHPRSRACSALKLGLRDPPRCVYWQKGYLYIRQNKQEEKEGVEKNETSWNYPDSLNSMKRMKLLLPTWVCLLLEFWIWPDHSGAPYPRCRAVIDLRQAHVLQFMLDRLASIAEKRCLQLWGRLFGSNISDRPSAHHIPQPAGEGGEGKHSRNVLPREWRCWGSNPGPPYMLQNKLDRNFAVFPKLDGCYRYDTYDVETNRPQKPKKDQRPVLWRAADYGSFWVCVFNLKHLQNKYFWRFIWFYEVGWLSRIVVSWRLLIIPIGIL